ncbi:predicted protein [Scheffersomyces stipitis CBS 6054]|uniref:Uncharacterized protein n=1 Tax=Scheffersomyces stipitis (strain ATCC 58785 / CBS 6054 / NBRC 10063 / NRRL Y-11545) TaxID=322104 RepID=A3GH54_PICST|nr:predicted protein [Scheffersomyces stipitis CBS 6054]EAZ62762.2 predicted protein [Scheffersomyces stipitis CBS 6054]
MSNFQQVMSQSVSNIKFDDSQKLVSRFNYREWRTRMEVTIGTLGMEFRGFIEKSEPPTEASLFILFNSTLQSLIDKTVSKEIVDSLLAENLSGQALWEAIHVESFALEAQ